MSPTEIIARFLVRFAFKGFPPLHDHDSAKSKDAVVSQVANALYLDCSQNIEAMEAILTVCIRKGWIVAPFGLALGLGINQPTFEATQAGLEKGQEFLAVLNEQG